jgi:hypothetical protein
MPYLGVRIREVYAHCAHLADALIHVHFSAYSVNTTESFCIFYGGWA